MVLDLFDALNLPVVSILPYIHFAIALLVAEPQAKTSPISEGEKFRQLFSNPSITTFNYNQKGVESLF
jgi:hypothetical protein